MQRQIGYERRVFRSSANDATSSRNAFNRLWRESREVNCRKQAILLTELATD